MIPNFLIVGAPKCGTTAMWRYLHQHPEIYLSQRKDLHFFGSDLDFLKRQRFSKDEYLSHFEQSNQKAIGEASVWYLYSQNAAKEIFEYNPKMKIIIMLRDPVQMIYAHYTQMKFNGLGDEDLSTFEEALEAETDRKNGLRIPKHCPLTCTLFYREIAKVATQIERYQNIFPKEQILFLFQEDMKTNMAELYRNTLHFLDVDTIFSPDFARVNTHKEVRFELLRKVIGKTPQRVKDKIPQRPRTMVSKAIRKYNSKHAERKTLSPETDVMIRKELDGEIQKLSEICKRDLEHWRV
jgi:hypothetical protein